MAYLLRFAGGERVATATAIALSNVVGFRITVDALFSGMSSGFLPIIGRDSASTQRIMFYGTSASNINGIRVGGSTNSAIPAFDWTTRKSVAIESTATTLKIIIDGVLHAEVTRTINFSTLNEICKGATIPAAPSDLYGYQIEIGGALVHNYDPTASGGAGTTLTDIQSGNSGTLVGFPTDNTQWIRTDAVTRAGSRFLRFAGGSSTTAQYLSTPAFGQNAATFEIEFDVLMRSTGNDYRPVFSNGQGIPNNRNAFFFYGTSRAELAFIIGGVRRVINAPPSTFSVNTRYNIKIIYNGSLLNFLVDGALVGSVAATGSVNTLGINLIGLSVNEAQPDIDLYFLKYTEGGVLQRHYLNTTGTGTEWVNQVGGNNAIQVRTWPTDDSEWILYNSITQTQPLTSLSAAVGTPTSINLNAYFSGATAYQIYSGALPQGLSIVGNSIVGTATQAGTVTCVIRAYNDYDTLDSGVVSFVVEAGGGVVPFTGTLTKLSLSISNKSLQTQLGQSLSLSKDTLTLSNKSLQTSAGYVNILAKQEITQDNKQLSVSSGYVDPLNKESLTLQNKLLSVQAGSAISFVGEIGKLPLSLVGKQLAISAGYNSNVSKQDLIVDGKSNDILAGFNATLSEQSLTLTNKQLTLVTGTAISFVGELGKSALNISNKLLDVTTGTAIPYQGVLQKTSLSISYKLLDTTRGYISTLQKEALELVGKDLSFGLPTYPIIPIERLFTMKGDDGRTYLMKQTTTIYIMRK